LDYGSLVFPTGLDYGADVLRLWCEHCGVADPDKKEELAKKSITAFSFDGNSGELRREIAFFRHSPPKQKRFNHNREPGQARDRAIADWPEGRGSGSARVKEHRELGAGFLGRGPAPRSLKRRIRT